MTRRVSSRAVATLAVLVATAVVGLTVFPRGAYGWLHTTLTSPWFPVVLVVAFLIRPLFAVPLSPLSVLVGLQYGIVPGIFVVSGGTVVTCLVPYAAGRWLRDEGTLFARLAEPGEAFFDRATDTLGVTVARLSPAPADAVSYGAGLSDVSLRAFVVGTVLGEAPWALVYVTLGSQLDEFRVPSIPSTVTIGAAVVSVTVATVVVVVDSAGADE